MDVKGKEFVAVPTIPQGWECPKCGAVMNPNKEVCVNCTGKQSYKTSWDLGDN